MSKSEDNSKRLSDYTKEELVEELCNRGVFHIKMPKTGKAELALEDTSKKFEKYMPDGKRYLSSYFYDEFHEGECTILVVK